MPIAKAFQPSQWPRTVRLGVMLALTSSLFLVELIVGYAVNSIALVADSFHMLSDVLSMIVAMYAIKLAKRKRWSTNFTYGWQRAEVLGALVNGVFLLALCFTIIVEAIERFVNPVEIEDPKMVLIVGGVGLLVNLLGLVLFHEHGHAHGHSHGHSHGHAHGHSHADALSHPVELKHTTTPSPRSPIAHPRATSSDPESVDSRDGITPSPNRLNPYLPQAPIGQSDAHLHGAHGRRSPAPAGAPETTLTIAADTVSPLSAASTTRALVSSSASTASTASPAVTPVKHNHNKMASLNMHGVFLHVLGDALGSVAVMVSALIIWLAPWPWRFMVDPVLSLIITAIILWSTIPLVRRASAILLQGTPPHINMDEIRDEVLALKGVQDIHELHVWQLSDTKTIASVHVVCSNHGKFMDLAVAIKQILHDYGIHSVTVQPEYHDDDSVFRAKRKASTMSASVSSGGAMAGAQSDNGAAHESTMTMTAPCLLRCTDEDCEPAECCPSDVVMEWRRGSVVTMGAATSSAIVGLTVVSQRSPSPAAHDGRNSP